MTPGQHLCEYLLSLSGAKAFEIAIVQDNTGWILRYEVFADESDVRSGEARFPGEQLGEVAIAIKYCPFCGHLLSGDESSRN